MDTQTTAASDKELPYTPEHRDRLVAFREQRGWSNEQLGKQIGKSAHVVYMYLRGEYAGSWREVERDLLDAVDRIETLQLPASGLHRTVITDRVAAGLRRAWNTLDIALLHGPAGTGKSVGCLKFAQDNRTAIHLTAQRWAASPMALEHLIFLRLETRDWKRRGSRGQYLVNKLRGANRLVIIDNAQRLGVAALQWLFDFHDETGNPIGLVGNSEVLTKVAANDQMHSRIGLSWRVAIEGATDKTLETFVEIGTADLPADARRQVANAARKVVTGPGHASNAGSRWTSRAVTTSKKSARRRACPPPG